jgi:hypothetical protein
MRRALSWSYCLRWVGSVRISFERLIPSGRCQHPFRFSETLLTLRDLLRVFVTVLIGVD